MISSPGTIRKKRNFKNLALDENANENAPPGGSAHAHNVPLVRGSAAGGTGAQSATGTAHYSRREQLPDLELGVEFKLDLRSEDLQTLEELGAGNGGTVSRVIHLPTKSIMARKVGVTARTKHSFGRPFFFFFLVSFLDSR